jgi:U2 small nuclear ribonucleoprotein A'
MRITAELLSQTEQRTNPIGDRELVLRDLGIPLVENLGAARDDFDSYDLSNNRISRLENFPRLLRLAHLHCSGNLIEAIDGKNIQKNIPNLISLVLSHNNISYLAEVANIGEACLKLEFLSLVGNPVTRKLYILSHANLSSTTYNII